MLKNKLAAKPCITTDAITEREREKKCVRLGENKRDKNELEVICGSNFGRLSFIFYNEIYPNQIPECDKLSSS